MCGIISAINTKGDNVNETISGIFELQKHRGRDGFGFVDVTDDSVHLSRFTDESDVLEELGKVKSNIILFHHRIPTSTTNNVNSNHPIFTDNNILYEHNYYMIHNGHITNSIALRKEHEDNGIKYNSDEGLKFTDSESLLHELALIVEGFNLEKDFNAKGGMAFIMLQTDKLNNPTALYFGRNEFNPIKIRKTEDSIILQSECDTGEMVEPHKLFRYDLKTKEMTNVGVQFGNIYIPPSVITETAISGDQFIDAICNIYEYNFIYTPDLNKLDKNQITKLLIISRRVAKNMLTDVESKLLILDNYELILLKTKYNKLISTIKLLTNKI